MTHASLFSGIGGPEVAAQMLGWENLFHCEINPFGRAVLEYWFPNSKSYEDITKTNFEEWRGRVDVLTGGFPCQPFSYAGKRGGGEDERYLWPEMLRVISEVRPTWVVGENVAGITTMVEGGVLSHLGDETTLFGEVDGVHRYGLRQSFTIERICKDLEGCGYSVQPVLIPAAAVGAPHRRDRVFFLAHNDADADGHYDVRDAGEDAEEGREERLQERDEVRFAGEPDQLRPEVQRTSSNTDCRRRGEIPTSIHSGFADGYEPFSDGSDRFATDTDSQGREEPVITGRRKNSPEKGGRVHDRVERPGGYGCIAKTERAKLYPERKWPEFPTVSPVHRGNDGLPFALDDLTISATKWRTESLKAYGNAIVPQVMYRIFQMIDKIDHEDK